MLAWLTFSAWGQEHPDRVNDISGVWRSDSGAVIQVLPYVYGPQRRFVIQATFRNGQQRYQAEWMAGFRQQFRYKTADGDEVMGVVDRDGSNVHLGNGRNWQTYWRRSNR